MVNHANEPRRIKQARTVRSYKRKNFNRLFLQRGGMRSRNLSDDITRASKKSPRSPPKEPETRIPEKEKQMDAFLGKLPEWKRHRANRLAEEFTVTHLGASIEIPHWIKKIVYDSSSKADAWVRERIIRREILESLTAEGCEEKLEYQYWKLKPHRRKLFSLIPEDPEKALELLENYEYDPQSAIKMAKEHRLRLQEHGPERQKALKTYIGGLADLAATQVYDTYVPENQASIEKEIGEILENARSFDEAFGRFRLIYETVKNAFAAGHSIHSALVWLKKQPIWGDPRKYTVKVARKSDLKQIIYKPVIVGTTIKRKGYSELERKLMPVIYRLRGKKDLTLQKRTVESRVANHIRNHLFGDMWYSYFSQDRLHERR